MIACTGGGNSVLGMASARWGLVNHIWGSVMLFHLSGAISRYPLHSLPIPCRHRVVLGTWLSVENWEQNIQSYTPPPPLLKTTRSLQQA